MNACTVCSSKYPFLLNDCFFENDQITCFRVEVIKNIFNTTINFILCQIVLVRFFRVNRSSRGFAKNSFFLTLPGIQGFIRVRIAVMLASLQLLSLLQPELEAGLLQIWVVEDLELFFF